MPVYLQCFFFFSLNSSCFSRRHLRLSYFWVFHAYSGAIEYVKISFFLLIFQIIVLYISYIRLFYFSPEDFNYMYVKLFCISSISSIFFWSFYLFISFLFSLLFFCFSSKSLIKLSVESVIKLGYLLIYFLFLKWTCLFLQFLY